MDIDKLKSDLQTKGYTQFNLKDFNEDYYNELLPLKCNETQNLKHLLTNYRLEGNLISKSSPSDTLRLHKSWLTFDVAKTEMDEISSNMDNIIQNWYWYDYHHLPLGDTIEKIKHNITRNLFLIDDSIKLKNFLGQITFFDYGCRITNHADGTYYDRVCAIMIYLNETYDINDGGILKLNNEEEVLPIFGNVAIISLDKNANPEHAVSKVTGGIGRYALTTFINYEVE
jgi:Rps23 Pro-64 3,4-dihydroxylase Tpa1-like proline 4-hydroxylase